MEAAADGALVADVARRHDITRQHIYQWRRELRDNGQPLIGQSHFVAVELAGRDENRDMVGPAEVPGAVVAHHVEIMLRNGRSLRVMVDVPDKVLHRLMRIAEQS
ncbi:MAG: transposase family protein [Methylocystaceae bacterium]|nr:MAG: transposase family protein [Methylocystaceae bacterium]KAF0209729.1 MAG: transposase family [Methylocystaceae bacterium]TXT42388.1 MAG: transposase family protein [Methylocystaceae bacterium]